jgi:DTW domain-containing protein YfiP
MPTIKRIYCLQCKYPKVTCVCDAVTTIILPIKVIVLQHKKEKLHSKNTIRLACLVSPSIQVINTTVVTETNQLLADLDINHAVVLYPSSQSKAIEGIGEKRNQIHTIILIDGSWKQAYSIWQSFPKLRSFAQIHFEFPPQKQYEIRKSKKTYQLSSIEALSYSIATLTKIDTSAYGLVFAKMQERWRKIHSQRSGS